MNLDQSVKLSNHFESTYKVTSTSPITTSIKFKKATQSVYQTKIVPLFLFNCMVNLNYTRTQIESIQRTACTIINSDTDQNYPIVLRNLYDLVNQHACIHGPYMLDGLFCFFSLQGNRYARSRLGKCAKDVHFTFVFTLLCLRLFFMPIAVICLVLSQWEVSVLSLSLSVCF